MDVKDIYRNIPGPFMVFNAENYKFDYISNGLLDLFGCTEEVFTDRYYNSFEMLVYKADRKGVKEQILFQSENGNSVILNFRIKGLLDNVMFVEFRGNIGEFEGHRVISGMMSDMTEMVLAQRELGRMNERMYANNEAKQEELRDKIIKDAMTGILNKAATQSSIEDILAGTDTSHFHALFMIDTDHFKNVNDTFGHQFGDETIKMCANIIKKTFRDSDIVGRVGGDEFMVFMKDTTREVTEKKAAELNESFRRKLTKDDMSVDISCSIGVAFYPLNGQTYDVLFAGADEALYDAKELGRDRYVICK